MRLRSIGLCLPRGRVWLWGPEKTFNVQKGIETIGVEEWARAKLMKETLL